MSESTVSSARPAPRELYALVAVNARLWAAEAEIFSTYFAAPNRSAATDEVWLARQCFKELIDGVVGRLGQLTTVETRFERTVKSADAALTDAGVRVELKHYVAFAIAHRVSQHEGAPANVTARIGADWPENSELQNMRARQRRDDDPADLPRCTRRAMVVQDFEQYAFGLDVIMRRGRALHRHVTGFASRVNINQWDAPCRVARRADFVAQGLCDGTHFKQAR